MKTTDQKKKGNKTKTRGVVGRLACRFPVMICLLAVAVTLSIFFVSRDAYAEYTKEQYCREQALLGKNPTICASPADQQKAKINDPNYDAKASQEEQEFQKAKNIAEGKDKQDKDSKEKKDQDPEHKDDGDGSNKKDKDDDKNKDSSGSNKGSGSGSGGSNKNDCGSVKTFFDWGCKGVDDSKIVVTMLITISNWLAVGATVIVIGGIIYGSIVYATSAGDAAKAKQGIGIIRNAIIALVLYLLMWAILQYAVPGGLFN